MFREIMEKVYRLIAFAICGGIALYGVIAIAYAVKHSDGGSLAMGLVCSMIAAFLFAYLVIPPIAEKMAFGFYTPKNVKPLPPEFPLIQAKIKKEEYAGAIADLEKLLEKDPGNYHVVSLLVDVFVDRIDDHGNAIGLITAYLKKDERCPEDLPLVMKLVDVYLEIDNKEKAVALLDKEIKMKYRDIERKQLIKRLEGIVMPNSKKGI